MNKTVLSAASLACLLPSLAIAESPNWTYVEASYLSSELDVDGYDEFAGDIEPDGYELAGSVGIGDWVFVDIAYSDESDDVKVDAYWENIKVDLDLERLRLGVGAAWGVTESTDLYGRLAYEDWTLEASAYGESEDVDENGYSYAVGVRSVLWDVLELRGEVGQVDLDDLGDETQLMLGAYYTVAQHFTIGASYTDMDDFETIKATLRYQF